MDPIAEFKGQNGKLIVYDDYLAISRDTFGGFVSQRGFVGERKYFYKDINSFEYKKPTLIANGYFKIIVAGSIETNAKVGLLSSSTKSFEDQNTIVLRAFTKKVGDETEKIYKLIMQKLIDSKKNISSEKSSKMDELKKLGELKASGILTDEEFQKEKEKILNS